MLPIRVLIVDDSAVVRRILSDVLSGDPELNVLGASASARLALARIRTDPPDVVILDVDMPDMSGLAMLKDVRASYPSLPVIMYSTLTERGAAATLDALALGATDYVTKPSNVRDMAGAVRLIRQDLIPRVKCFGGAAGITPASARAWQGGGSVAPAGDAGAGSTRGVDIVAIGASTGGPNVLTKLMAELPGDFPVPIVIAQHMPPVFTRILSERLAAISPLRVAEGVDGSRLRAGDVWVAPGDHHMVVKQTAEGVEIRLNQNSPENFCRPAVDALFSSVAATFGRGTLAVVLTGMGQDGVRGCRAVRDAGGQILAQDEISSVVWGMPGSVVRAGLAERTVPAVQLTAELTRRTKRRAR